MSQLQDSPEPSRPLFADGLEILDGSTPWRDSRMLPPKPGGFLYGVRFKNHPKLGNSDYPCGSEDELKQVIAESGNQVEFVYLPDRDLGIPRLSLNIYHSWEKSDLRKMFFRTLQSRGLVAAGSIGAAIYLNSEHSFTLFLLGLIFGIVPVFDTLIQWLMFPKGESPDELKKSMVHGSLFFGWIEKSKRSKLLIWISLALLGAVYYGQTGNFEAFTNEGKIQPQAIRADGEWWRLLTGPLMHGAIWHIAMNGLGFFYIGKFIHRLTSPVLVIIVFVVSALAGAFASTLFSSDLGSVGASGGVVGMIGFLAWLVVVRWKALPYDFRSFTIRNILLLSILGAIGFFFVDNAGHAGGFLGGIFCGIIYDFFHKNRWDVPDSPVKIALGVLCSALFLLGFACCMDLFFFGGQRLVSHLPRLSW